MDETHPLRAQISGTVQANFPSIDMGFNPNISPPKANQVKAIRQLIAASFIDQVAIRKRYSTTAQRQRQQVRLLLWGCISRFW